jgi:hypothetical protein
MKKGTRSIALMILSVGSIAVLLLCIGFLSVQVGAQQNKQTQQPQVYNPYPPGILPPDSPQEIERVRGEISFIENEAIGEWHALGPVTYTGQPPIIQGNGYAAMRVLGKLMNYDENISPFKNIACASCHMPYAGFSGPIPSVNLTMIAYPGSFHFRAGKRTAQRYTYSPASMGRGTAGSVGPGTGVGKGSGPGEGKCGSSGPVGGISG